MVQLKCLTPKVLCFKPFQFRAPLSQPAFLPPPRRMLVPRRLLWAERIGLILRIAGLSEDDGTRSDQMDLSKTGDLMCALFICTSLAIANVSLNIVGGPSRWGLGIHDPEFTVNIAQQSDI
jgi:hypothetical protein